MAIDLEELRRFALKGPCVRVVIADHKGSAPRETGTSMLVNMDGCKGTIGGGALEFSAIATARAMLGNGQMNASQTIPLGPNLGQCCGGSVVLVFESFSHETLPEAEGVFARAIADAPQSLKVKRALKSFRNASRPNTLLWVDNWIIEPVAVSAQPLWIYGAGHVGRALIDVFWDLPFDITWVDTSVARFPETIPPDVTKLVAADPAAVVKHAPADAYHLILTYSHAIDLALCHAVLSRDFAFCGVIGSASKAARFRSRLASLGLGPETIAKLTCPIGNPALGKEPKAIALGVATDLLARPHKTTRMKDQNYG